MSSQNNAILDAKITYQEAAQLLRHYSTMRGSLVSFLLTASLAMGGWALTNRNTKPLVYYLAACEFAVYLFAVVVCVYFSTYVNKMRKVLIRIESGQPQKLYQGLDTSRFAPDMRFDVFDWLIVIGGASIHLSMLAYYVYSASSGGVPQLPVHG